MRARSIVLLAAVLLAGCGDSGPELGTGDRSGSLDGRTFVATGIEEDGEPRPLLEGTELRIAFARGEMTFQAGCNSMTRGYEWHGSSLQLGGDVMGTVAGCDGPRHEQDEWLSDALAGTLGAELEGDLLVLTDGGRRFTFSDREVASPDRSLVGTEWQLDTLVEGEVAGSSPGMTATLTISDDGTYAVDTGCNTGSGRVARGETTLTFTPPGLTRLACEGDGAAVEEAMAAVLDGEVTYEIEEQRLTLTVGDRGLGFRSPA